MDGIFASYLWTTVLGKRLLNILNHVIFPAKIQKVLFPNAVTEEKTQRSRPPLWRKNYDISAEVIKNCVKYIFVGRCLFKGIIYIDVSLYLTLTIQASSRLKRFSNHLWNNSDVCRKNFFLKHISN
jgi:hypothetical protein